MKSLILKLVVGVVLFVGALVGGLAATGRLNHQGTANIPLLGTFFPAPPTAEGGNPPEQGAAGEHAPAARPAPAGEVADGKLAGAPGEPVDAAHQQGPQGDPAGPVRQKVGRSVLQPEVKTAGGDHGEAGAKQGEQAGGGDPHKGGEKPPDHAAPPPRAGAAHGEHAVEQDMQRIEDALAGDKDNQYVPGGLFRFDGMPAGLTPEQINEAWQRVQGVLGEIERRKTALDLREQELQELADDISRRQHELGAERNKIDQRHRDLDARIQKFQEQVKLVRNDEVAALKRNAQTLASFEPSKAAELVTDQWKSERGQDEVLKTLEFMDRDAVNEILKELPNPMVQDLLKKRLRVSKESTPSTPGK